jgi:hypothetical protein
LQKGRPKSMQSLRLVVTVKIKCVKAILPVP